MHFFVAVAAREGALTQDYPNFKGSSCNAWIRWETWGLSLNPYLQSPLAIQCFALRARKKSNF